jgi:tetratricopeptide (TPR) repeat protein
MKRSAGIVGLFVLLLSVAHGGAPGKETLDRSRTVTLEGMRFLYNFNVARAHERFAEAIELAPNYPRPYLALALAPLWKSFVTRSDSDHATAVRMLTETIAIAHRYLDEVDARDADVLTCLGTAYGYRTYISFVQKSYVRAAWDAKRCYDYLVEATRANPQFADPYLGLGLYHFSVASIPKPLQWLMSILGVDGDRDLGLREVERAAQKGTYNSVEAKFFLIQFLPWYKGDFETSEAMADELIRTYPSNTVFLYVKGFMKQRRGNLEEAMRYFLRMKSVANPYFAVINKFAELRLGECYFRLGEYAKARDAYLAFLSMNNRGQFEAVAAYHAGLCVELLGDREGALPHYSRAKGFESAHGDDIYSARHAGLRLVSPMTLVDSLMVVARNFHRRNMIPTALETYTDLLARYTLTNDQRAEIVFRMGDCYYDADRYDEAAEQFRSALELKVLNERWVIPWSHFMLGQIALKKGDLVAARREFERVNDFDNYDHKNWLTFRAEREIEKMNNVK